jgi:transposase-like protein
MRLERKIYSSEFKEQIVKEVYDTGKMSIVAKNHKLPLTTLHAWVNAKTKIKSKDQDTNVLQLKKKLVDAELEIRVLKDILKKTNQAWLKE